MSRLSQTVRANLAIVNFFRARGRAVIHAELRARRRFKSRWFDLVRRSTWLSPRPSPRNMIIFNTKAPGQYEYGWIPYRGSASRARARLDRRLVKFRATADKIFADLVRDLERGGGR